MGLQVLIALLLLMLPASSYAADAPSFIFPADCMLDKNCWTVNHVDVDPTLGSADFTCANKTYDDHKGTDFGLRSMKEMKDGINVLAAADGEILRIRDGESDSLKNEAELDSIKEAKKECGNGVLIDHAKAGFPGLRTMYCHLKLGSITVKPKQKIKKGDVIAQIGNSGLAEFPHLHFGVIWEDEVIDPFTGSAPADGCKKPQNSMWETKISYQPLSIYDGGFAATMPDFKAIERGMGLQKPDKNADALVFWAAYYGAQQGDKITITIQAPNGKTFVKREMTQEKTRARQYYYAGRKLNGKTLSAGSYTGQIKIQRNGVGAPKIFTKALSIN